MGFSIKSFLVNEDDTFKQLTTVQHKKLFEKDATIRLPEYKNTRVRCVEIVVELVNRNPVEIVHASYSYFQFDAQGGIDQAYVDEMNRVIAEMMGGFPSPNDPENLINAADRFARKRFREKFTWEPSEELERALFDRAL
ncbi:MAG: hypothetical protein ACLFQY_22930, partial [Desulfococcaceae bacterium]